MFPLRPKASAGAGPIAPAQSLVGMWIDSASAPTTHRSYALGRGRTTAAARCDRQISTPMHRECYAKLSIATPCGYRSWQVVRPRTANQAFQVLGAVGSAGLAALEGGASGQECQSLSGLAGGARLAPFVADRHLHDQYLETHVYDRLRRPAGRVLPIRSVTSLTTFLLGLAAFSTGPKSSTSRSKTLTAICCEPCTCDTKRLCSSS